MSTVQIAAACKREIENEDWEPDYDNPDGEIRRLFIGTVMALDPCGKFHHFLSPNGATKRCEQFWTSLERQLERRNLSLASGEGDPCDQFAEQYRDREE